MSLFKKSDKLAEVCYDIRGPIMQEARQLEEDGYHLIKLNIGNPALFGFNAPDEIIRDVILNLKKPRDIPIHKVYFLPVRRLCNIVSKGKFMVLN